MNTCYSHFLLRSLLLLFPLLISCNSGNETAVVSKVDSAPKTSSLDTLKPYRPMKNIWIKTRIHWNSLLDTACKIHPTSSNSYVLEFEEFYHTPGTSDDQVLIDNYIYVSDSSVIRLNSNYPVPNKYMMIRSLIGGAWVYPPEQRTNIKGEIRFESVQNDSCVVRLRLNGDMGNNSTNRIVNHYFVSNEITFYRNGKSEWEWNYKLDSLYWDELNNDLQRLNKNQ